MAVPKTTETRCRNGSVQERQGIQTLHKYPHPYIHLLFVCDILLSLFSETIEKQHYEKKDVGMGIFVWCLYFLSFLHTLSYTYLYTALLPALRGREEPHTIQATEVDDHLQEDYESLLLSPTPRIF